MLTDDALARESLRRQLHVTLGQSGTQLGHAVYAARRRIQRRDVSGQGPNLRLIRQSYRRVARTLRTLRRFLARRGLRLPFSLVSSSDAWDVRELADGWKETVAVARAPAGVIEAAALGLKGCEVRFRFDAGLTESRIQQTDIAKMFRPVQAGDHEIGIQWRGAAKSPEEAGLRFHPLIQTLARMEREAPDVAAVMKKNNPKGFVLCDAWVLSQPEGKPCQVYGIFTVDRKALASGAPGAAVVKQDFLVHDQTREPPEITYYTGLRTPGPHKSIEAFCERFGASNYGCEWTGKRWRCRDHHYRLEEFDRLPKEPEFRKAIEAAIQQARRPE